MCSSDLWVAIIGEPAARAFLRQGLALKLQHGAAIGARLDPGKATRHRGVLALGAAARGAVGPLVGTLSRLFTGYYFYWRRSYPDLISASQCILLRRPDGETEMCVDTIFGERTLQAVIGNPFKAWLLRQTAEFATDADPLIRLNEYGPKRRRWFRRRMRARDIAALRRQIRRRYRALYAPLVRA